MCLTAFGSATHRRSSYPHENAVNTPLVHDFTQTYPKWAIKTGNGSIVLQEAFFNDTGVLALPIPLMTFGSQ